MTKSEQKMKGKDKKRNQIAQKKWSLCGVLLMLMQASGAGKQCQSRGVTVILSNSSSLSSLMVCLLCGSRGSEDTDVCTA